MTELLIAGQIDPLLRLVATSFTVVVLARAIIEKLLDYEVYIANLREYQLLPEQFTAGAAAALVLAEIAAVVCLLAPAWATIGGVLTMALLALYAAAMTAAMVRGNSEIECGCGGEGQIVTSGLVVRNAVLIVIAGSILMPTSGRPMTWSDILGGSLAVLVGFLLLAIAEQIIKNSAAIRRSNAWQSD